MPLQISYTRTLFSRYEMRSRFHHWEGFYLSTDNLESSLPFLSTGSSITISMILSSFASVRVSYFWYIVPRDRETAGLTNIYFNTRTKPGNYLVVSVAMPQLRLIQKCNVLFILSFYWQCNVLHQLMLYISMRFTTC